MIIRKKPESSPPQKLLNISQNFYKIWRFNYQFVVGKKYLFIIFVLHFVAAL